LGAQSRLVQALPLFFFLTLGGLTGNIKRGLGKVAGYYQRVSIVELGNGISA